MQEMSYLDAIIEQTWTIDFHKPESTVEWSSHMCREVKLHLFSLQRVTSKIRLRHLVVDTHTNTRRSTAIARSCGRCDVFPCRTQLLFPCRPTWRDIIGPGVATPGQCRADPQNISWEVVVNVTIKAKTNSISGKFPWGRKWSSDARRSGQKSARSNKSQLWRLWFLKMQHILEQQSNAECKMCQKNTFIKNIFWQESAKMGGRNKLFSWKQETFDCECLLVAFQWNVFLKSTLMAVILHHRLLRKRIRARKKWQGGDFI